jgi:hypothetical protein
MTSRKFVRRAIVAALVTMTLAAKTASAQTTPNPSDQCYSQLGNCYYMAALQNGFWSMWAAGIDCELNFLDCVRRGIVGA